MTHHSSPGTHENSAQEPGFHTRAEIATFPIHWQTVAHHITLHRETMARMLDTPHTHIVFIGCGSAYFAGLSAAAWVQIVRDQPALALPASEVLHAPDVHLPTSARPLIVALSRSGETSETLAALAALRARYPGQPALLITCNETSSLSQAARPGDLVIALPIEEQSVVQTASLTSMLLCALMLFDPTLPPFPDPEVEKIFIAMQTMQSLGTHAAFDRFFFLGGGLRRGMASEAMLKVKEMSFCQSEAFHPLEFRHGLGANAAERSLITLLVSPQPVIAAAELTVLDDFRARGVYTLAIIPHGAARILVADIEKRDIRIEVPTHPVHALIAAQPLIQWMGLTRALHVGRDPDRPAHLSSFIHLAAADLHGEIAP